MPISLPLVRMGTAGRLQSIVVMRVATAPDYGEPGQYSANLSSSWYTIVQPYALF